jgi:hypothetical protein
VGVGGLVGRHSVGWVNCVRSCDTEYCYCCGCFGFDSWCLSDPCRHLLVVVGIGGVVVGIVDCVCGVVDSVGAGESVCSTQCSWVVGEVVGFEVVCVW